MSRPSREGSRNESPAPQHTVRGSQGDDLQGGGRRAIGVLPDTVGRWYREGRLPGYRMGRRLKFKWSEIERQLAQTRRFGPRP